MWAGTMIRKYAVRTTRGASRLQYTVRRKSSTVKASQCVHSYKWTGLLMAALTSPFCWNPHTSSVITLSCESPAPFVDTMRSSSVLRYSPLVVNNGANSVLYLLRFYFQIFVCLHHLQLTCIFIIYHYLYAPPLGMVYFHDNFALESMLGHTE